VYLATERTPLPLFSSPCTVGAVKAAKAERERRRETGRVRGERGGGAKRGQSGADVGKG